MTSDCGDVVPLAIEVPFLNSVSVEEESPDTREHDAVVDVGYVSVDEGANDTDRLGVALLIVRVELLTAFE